MYKLFPQSLKHTYFTSALALSIVSSSLLISKSAQAISLSWTKTTDTATQVVYTAPLTTGFTDTWTSFNQTGNFTIDNIPNPLTDAPITPTTTLNSATLNMSGNFIFNGNVTVPAGSPFFWSVFGTAEATNWNIAPGGVANLGGQGLGAGGGAGATDISNQTVAYTYSGTLNSPTEPVADSQVNLNYAFEPTPGGFASPTNITANGNGAPIVGFQSGGSVSVSYNYAAPPAPPRVIPFNYSKTPGLLVLGGIFGLKYALDRIKKKSHHRNLEKSSD